MFKNKALQNRCLYQIVRKNLVNDIAISSNRAVCILVSKNTKQPVKNDSFRPITFFNVLRAPEDTKSSHNYENIWTIPNCLCVLRISLSPVFGYLIIHSYFAAAVSILTVAAISDFLDGIIARSYKSQSSKLGSFLDPLADKILITTLFCSLTYVGLFPGSLTALIVLRDVILFCGGFYIWLKKPPILESKRALSNDVLQTSSQLKPTYLSKVNTAVQLLTGIFTLVSPIMPNIMTESVLYCFWYATGISTVTSGLSYLLSLNLYNKSTK